MVRRRGGTADRSGAKGSGRTTASGPLGVSDHDVVSVRMHRRGARNGRESEVHTRVTPRTTRASRGVAGLRHRGRLRKPAATRRPSTPGYAPLVGRGNDGAARTAPGWRSSTTRTRSRRRGRGPGRRSVLPASGHVVGVLRGAVAAAWGGQSGVGSQAPVGDLGVEAAQECGQGSRRASRRRRRAGPGPVRGPAMKPGSRSRAMASCRVVSPGGCLPAARAVWDAPMDVKPQERGWFG